ncbi:penicillin acylase family protein [Caldisphaera sp.]|uniref:penicillin acylase family protein n=1 Tax=Caldisphaera sp. TaxID=2060322 RepID=UPI0025C37D02|nr:penicillin acylase family protein [Caldisphaera sp.]
MAKKSYILIAVFLFILIFVSYLGQSFSLFSPSKNSIWPYSYTSKLKSQTIYLKGLKSPVKIIIDNNGVAHIYANDTYDAFYAEGYYTAYMRLFQLELFGLTGVGNLSSWFGNLTLSTDLYAHYVGFPQNANFSLNYVKENYPVIYSYLQAYSNGVNAYISQAESSHELPPIFYLLRIKPYNFTPYYSIAWGEVMSWGLAKGFCDELRLSLIYTHLGYNLTQELFPYYPYYTNGSLTAMPGNGTVNNLNLQSFNISPSYFWSLNFYSNFANGLSNETLYKAIPLIISSLNEICSDPLSFVDLGSNEWEVTGNYSSTGYPMMANDPHLTLYDPSLWLPLQLVSPRLNVTGYELVGEPGVLIGHTENTAWGLTTPLGASSNAYLEVVNMENHSYLFNGEWLPLKEYNFTLLNKKYTIYYTNNGPLVSYNNTLKMGISLYWVNQYYPFLTLVSEFLLDNSTNFSQLLNAARYWVEPTQNLAMVSKNETGFITAGLYPLIRITLPNNESVEVVGGRTILNGSIPNYEPVGYIPFNYLPQSINPERGFAFAPNQPTAFIDYPYPFVGGYWVSDGRALTIYRYLNSHRNMTISDMESLQSNVTDSWASILDPVMVSCLENENFSNNLKEGVLLLSAWNYTFYQNEVAPTIYTYTLLNIINNVVNPVLNEHGLTQYKNLLTGTVGFYGTDTLITSDLAYFATHNPNSSLFNGSFCKVVNSSYNEAMSYLSSKLGNISNWKWGNVHVLELINPAGISSLNYGPIPIWGDGFTPSAAYFNFNGTISIPLIVSEGPSLRIVDSPATNQFYSVFPGGPSENPASPWFETQLNSWLNFNYYPFSPVVEVNATWYLIPRGG